MAQQHFPANRESEMVLLALQVFQVLFLWVHDWIPLGRLNEVAAVRSQDTRRRLVTVTLIQSRRAHAGSLSRAGFKRPNSIMTALENRVAAEYGRSLPSPAAPEPVARHGRMREMWTPPYLTQS
jgi:hypothetical protein